MVSSPVSQRHMSLETEFYLLNMGRNQEKMTIKYYIKEWRTYQLKEMSKENQKPDGNSELKNTKCFLVILWIFTASS